MESWGYREDENYYTDRHLLRSIDKYLARDANYLLNVGPDGDGTIPRRVRRHPAADRRVVPRASASRSTGPSRRRTLTANRNVLLTRKGNTLYVHLHRDPVERRGEAQAARVACRDGRRC